MKAVFSHKGEIHLVDMQQNGLEYLVESASRPLRAKVVKAGLHEIQLLIDGQEKKLWWAKQGRRFWLHFDGRSYYVEKQASDATAGGSAASGERIFRAPMPGQVRQVLALDGQEVKVGDTLVLLEAMKMEIRIQASQSGKVARVAVKQGQSVEKDQVLVELE